MATYLLDLGTTISASVSYCLIQSLWFNLQKMYNKPWKRRASPTSCHVHKEKEMMGQTGNLATVSIPQIYITKKFKFPTENEFQIH